MCEPRNEFPYAPYWYVVPVTTQGNFKHYMPFKKTRLKAHFIHGPKSIILLISFTYVNTTINTLSITEANRSTQTRSFISNAVSRINVFLYLKHNHYSPFIYLVYTKRSIHERISS